MYPFLDRVYARGMTNDFTVSTRDREQLLDITDRVQAAVADSGVMEGTCLVHVPHTTAGVLVNENADPDVARDILTQLRSMVPRESGFQHAEENADAHIKAILVGSTQTLPIRGGLPALGTWQGIFLAEFDGPRVRKVSVTCMKG